MIIIVSHSGTWFNQSLVVYQKKNHYRTFKDLGAWGPKAPLLTSLPLQHSHSPVAPSEQPNFQGLTEGNRWTLVYYDIDLNTWDEQTL